MPVPETVVNYVIAGIEGTPEILRSILGRFASNDPLWDERPDPDRFTLREMIAHVADWEPIFLERVQRMVGEDNPHLPSVDEGAMAAKRNYDLQDPVSNLDRFANDRPTLVSLIKSLTPQDLDRTAHREFVGDLNLFQLLTMILSHDAYHIRQAAAMATVSRP